VILEQENKIFRNTTLEFRDFFRVFQDLCLFPGPSSPENLNVLISGLSRTFQGVYEPWQDEDDALKTSS